MPEIDCSVFSSRVVIIVWESVGVQILSPLNPHLGYPFRTGTPNTENVHISVGNEPILIILVLFCGYLVMLILDSALQNLLVIFMMGLGHLGYRLPILVIVPWCYPIYSLIFHTYFDKLIVLQIFV